MERIRSVLGPGRAPCLLCGATDVVQVESRRRKRGLRRLHPGWDEHLHIYDECRACGAQRRE